MPAPPHIAIIGAGPAGCAAAITLARASIPITIIEAKPFPRAKVCGEFVSPAATALLERFLSPDELRTAGARTVDRFVMELGERERVFHLPTPAWSLSRRSLDAILLAKAVASGAQVLQPAAVRSVEYAADTARLTLTDGREISADLVIHADGSGRHDPTGPIPTDPRLIGHKCHLRIPAPLAGVRIRACPGAYVGTIAIEDGESTCALAATRPLIAKHNGDADAMLQSLWPRYNPAWRTTPWLACGIPRSRYISPGHPRSLRIGNAAAAVDPVGGEGIGLALWSGATAADLLLACPLAARSGATDDARFLAMQRDFARLYRRRLRTRLPACRLAAGALMHPRLVAAAWPLLAFPALTIRPWYALTGKPIVIPNAKAVHR